LREADDEISWMETFLQAKQKDDGERDNWHHVGETKQRLLSKRCAYFHCNKEAIDIGSKTQNPTPSDISRWYRSYRNTLKKRYKKFGIDESEDRVESIRANLKKGINTMKPTRRSSKTVKEGSAEYIFVCNTLVDSFSKMKSSEKDVNIGEVEMKEGVEKDGVNASGKQKICQLNKLFLKRQ
jgi:hypothetical protein